MPTASHWPQGKTVNILCVGKKGFADILKRLHGNRSHRGRSLIFAACQTGLAFSDANAPTLAQRLLGMNLMKARLMCAHFSSPNSNLLFPRVPTAHSSSSRRGFPTWLTKPPMMKRLPKELLDLERRYLRIRAGRERDPGSPVATQSCAVQIFRALLENAASEQGARMSAMDNATRNAGEMIDKLTIRPTTVSAKLRLRKNLLKLSPAQKRSRDVKD